MSESSFSLTAYVCATKPAAVSAKNASGSDTGVQVNQGTSSSPDIEARPMVTVLLEPEVTHGINTTHVLVQAAIQKYGDGPYCKITKERECLRVKQENLGSSIPNYSSGKLLVDYKTPMHCHWRESVVWLFGHSLLPYPSGANIIAVTMPADDTPKIPCPDDKNMVMAGSGWWNQVVVYRNTTPHPVPGDMFALSWRLFNGDSWTEIAKEGKYWRTHSLEGGKVVGMIGETDEESHLYIVEIGGQRYACRPSDWLEYVNDDWVFVLRYDEESTRTTKTKPCDGLDSLSGGEKLIVPCKVCGVGNYDSWEDYDLKQAMDMVVMKGKILSHTKTSPSRADVELYRYDGTVRRTIEDCPIFFHCQDCPDDVSGGGAAFRKDDLVWVAQKPDGKFAVVAHQTELRKCRRPYVVFIVTLNAGYQTLMTWAGDDAAKKIVLVWNVDTDAPADDIGVSTPCDFDDEDFQAWYTGQSFDTTDMATGPNNDTVTPYKLRPDLVNPEVRDVWDNFHRNGISTPEAIEHSIGTECVFYEITDQDIADVTVPKYVGLRTSSALKIRNWELYSFRCTVAWDTLPGPISHLVWVDVDATADRNTQMQDWSVYENMARAAASAPPDARVVLMQIPSKEREEGTIQMWDHFEGVLVEYDDATFVEGVSVEYGGPYVATRTYVPMHRLGDLYAPIELRNLVFYGSFFDSVYGDHIVANVMLVQHRTVTVTTTHPDPGVGGPDVSEYAFGDRILDVSAQAYYVDDLEIEGPGWQAHGRNGVLEAAIKDAIEMAYTANSVLANAIVGARVNVKTIK